MKIFDLEVASPILDELAAHAEQAYPNEACGLILGPQESHGSPDTLQLVRMKNVQDRYHQLNPSAFPRTARDAFRLDELERMRVLEQAAQTGWVLRIIYHSHCDAGAYFSPEDRVMAVPQGQALMPGMIHLVVSVRQGRCVDRAAFRYDASRACFEELRLSMSPPNTLPELALRGLSMRAPDGTLGQGTPGILASRRVTAEEASRLGSLASDPPICIEDPEIIANLTRFELGLLSPLTGFLRTVEVRLIEQSGRLLSGTPWRKPVVLDLSARALSTSGTQPAPGALFELVDHAHRPLASMGLTEIVRVHKDRVRLAGPVYVYPTPSSLDAVATRTEILRQGWAKVLAIDTDRVDDSGINLTEFDGFLVPRPLHENQLALLNPKECDTWLAAVMAQNQGATHVWVEDPVMARKITDSLSIVPWKGTVR